jgi:very-short-patch-repair endonuclease
MRSSRNNVTAARELRKRMTATELAAWAVLRRRGFHGLRFRRQRPFGAFVVDFYCPRLKLAVEIDGSVHENLDQAQHDASRQATLESIGVHVVRIAASAIEANAREALEAAIAPFLPLI